MTHRLHTMTNNTTLNSDSNSNNNPTHPTKQQAVNGTWPSHITPQDVAGKAPKISEPIIHKTCIFWLQAQASEQGRVGIMMKNTQTPDEEAINILPAPFNVRSKVHEYGGGAYCVTDDYIAFVNSDDQQIYIMPHPQQHTDTTAYPLTHAELRFADLHYSATHHAILAVTEDHRGEEIKNALVAIPLPTTLKELPPIHTIHEGHDFYAYPRVSPNGKYLSFIAWNHPNMPWDNTALHIGTLVDTLNSFDQQTCFTNIPLRELQNESVFQPQWSPENDLFFVSDINNWWNIYSYSASDIEKKIEKNIDIEKNTGIETNRCEAKQHTALEAEFAFPLWNFNMSTYGFLNNHTILAIYNQNSEWHLCTLDTTSPDQSIKHIPQSCTVLSGIACDNNRAVFIGASPSQFPAVYQWHNATKKNTAKKEATATIQALTDTSPPLASGDVSVPQQCHFVSGQTPVSAFFYAPQNSQYESHDLPPMIVISHGGPTGQTDNAFNYKIQYWTNRGFAVLDVNYRGSTGYGREFRHLLQKQWGVYDVEDLIQAAEYVTQQGWAAADKKIIKGSSAGGYSVLAALTFSDAFNAGVSLYGIGDLELLAADTHKFEARYLDGLVGNYPEEKHIYQARSPINHIDKFTCPLLLFQGMEDKVVPPNQAQQITTALRNKGLAVEHIEYNDEGHGFRNPVNISHMMETEQAFYQRVFALV